MDSVVWSYGDGHTATGLATIHTYTISGTYHVCVTIYTPCGMDSVCGDVVVTVPSSVTIVHTLGNIKVYPNPANDEITVTGVAENTFYQILNLTGECLVQGLFRETSNSISIKQFASGVYILELKNKNGERKIFRVIKQ
jgi:hypothetical protein